MTLVGASVIAATGVVGEPRWSPDGRRVGWIEGAGGRTDVVAVAADGREPASVVSTQTRVMSIRATGGGAWCWVGSEHVAVVTPDGHLVVVGLDGSPVRVLSEVGRAGAPTATVDGSRIAFVVETDDASDVVVVPTSGAGSPVRVSGADYAWDPAWSPDGSRLAWHEWDLSAMSWDSSRIVVAAADGTGAVTVAGGPGVSVGQPRFAPDGAALAYVSDRTGWCNVWVAGSDGAGGAPLHAEAFEHAEPAWGMGQRSFAWAPDAGAIAYVRNEAGFARLVVAHRGAGAVTELAKGWHHGLDWGAHGIVAVRSGARTPPTVTVTGTITGTGPPLRRRVLARGAPDGIEEGFVEPEPVEWTADDGARVFGLLYRPEVAHDTPGLPALLVDVHGGPTGQATVQWKPSVQFFVARGWTVLAPDFRGSTGHGRAYTEALVEEWGRRDVADVASAIRAATTRGWADPDRVAATGNSAGGLTVLSLAATHPDLLRAVVSSYGVTDLAALASTTHRFESRYLDRMVGQLPAAADRYRERSPVHRAASIRVPTLVLHGDSDAVVLPSQAVALVEAMRAAGGIVEYHQYAGEGHGWSQEATVVDVYERTERFLRRWVLDAEDRSWS